MAELFSQYASGIQFTAGPTVGSTLGVSGVNAFVDRLNSITDNDGVYSNLGSGTGISIGAGSVVELTNKTSSYALPGVAFSSTQPNIGSIIYDTALGLVICAAAIPDGTLIAPINLPHGAVVTSARVQGNDTGNTWSLMKTDTTMASAAINSTDASITSATINNTISFENAYYFKIEGMGVNDEITFATISYTTDYD